MTTKQPINTTIFNAILSQHNLTFSLSNASPASEQLARLYVRYLTDMEANRRSDPVASQRIGMLAQVYSVISAEIIGFESARDALLAIIRRGLPNERDSQGFLSSLASNATAAEWEPYKKLDRTKLTTRYLLKGQNYIALVAIAATCFGMTTTMLLMSGYAYSGTANASGRPDWGNSWAREIGLTVAPFKAAIGTLLNKVMHEQNLSVAQCCALWSEGPFPKGFSVAALSAVQNRPSTDSDRADDTTDNDTNLEVNTMNTNATATQTNDIIAVNDTMKPMINAVLASAGIKVGIDEMLAGMAAASAALPQLEHQKKETEKRDQDIATLKAKLHAAVNTPMSMTITAPAGSTIPSGTSNMVKAEKVFPELQGLDFPVPIFTWDAPHPDVPLVQPDYQFRRSMLLKVLRALTGNSNTWLSGHTGTGKTTLIEQVAARLGWPVARIAFDSALDRAEMVGRMQLRGDGKGGTISEWLPGILERAITGNYILLCDEIDVSRPDALYTLQPLLEGKGLELLEDGGRRVNRSPLSRIVATGNTTGNGDPSGLYPSCRILAAATLDRFASWVIVPYMTEEEEMKLIKSSAPGLKAGLVKKLAKFATEMRSGFVNGNMPISYSPRRSIAFARAIADFSNMGLPEDTAKSLAFCQTIFDSAPVEFKQRIAELAQLTLDGINVNVEA